MPPSQPQPSADHGEDGGWSRGGGWRRGGGRGRGGPWMGGGWRGGFHHPQPPSHEAEPAPSASPFAPPSLDSQSSPPSLAHQPVPAFDPSNLPYHYGPFSPAGGIVSHSTGPFPPPAPPAAGFSHAGPVHPPPPNCRRGSFMSRMFHKAAHASHAAHPHPTSAPLYPPSAICPSPPTEPSAALAPITGSRHHSHFCHLLKMFNSQQPHLPPTAVPPHPTLPHPYLFQPPAFGAAPTSSAPSSSPPALVPAAFPQAMGPPSPNPSPTLSSVLGLSNLHRSQSDVTRLNHSYAPPPTRPTPLPIPPSSTYSVLAPASTDSTPDDSPAPFLLRGASVPTSEDGELVTPADPPLRAVTQPVPLPSSPPVLEPPVPSLSPGSMGFLQRAVGTWTYGEVWQWLHSIHLPQYPQFYHRRIDGDMLQDMTDNDLLDELHVKDKFHRGKILKRVRELVREAGGKDAHAEERKDRGPRDHHRHRHRTPNHGNRRSPHVSDRELPRLHGGPGRAAMTRASSVGATVSTSKESTSKEGRDSHDSDDVEYYVDVVEVYEVMGALKDQGVLEQWEQKVQQGGSAPRGHSPSALTDDVPDTHRSPWPVGHPRSDDSPISSSGSDDEAEEEERAQQQRERQRRRANRRSLDRGSSKTQVLHTQPNPNPMQINEPSRPPPTSPSPLPVLSPTAVAAGPEPRNLADTVSATFAALSAPTGLTSSPSHPQLAGKRASASLYPPPQPMHPSHSDTSLSSSLPHTSHPAPLAAVHTPQPHHSSHSALPSHHPAAHHHPSASSPTLPTSAVPTRIDRLSSTLTTHPTFIDEVTNLTILNEGVAGHAYRGSYHSLPVVVKLPKSLEISGQEWREWQAHLRLPPHPHLVQFLGALVMVETNYLVTALIKQGSLKNVLAGNGARLYSGGYAVMRAALEIGRGLCHLHRHRIVHRDISSRNILVEADGTFIIADLGLCREMGKAMEPSPEDSYEMGRSTAIPVRWTAPEALLTSTYNSRTDVWSLGVTLWEMTAGGRVPYGQVDGNRQLIQGLLAGEVGLKVDEDWAREDEDGGLAVRARRVIDRCLIREVEKRPSSVELVELVERELEEWEKAGGDEVEDVKREWEEYHRALAIELAKEDAGEEEGEEDSSMEELSKVMGARLVTLQEVSETQSRSRMGE